MSDQRVLFSTVHPLGFAEARLVPSVVSLSSIRAPRAVLAAGAG